MKLRFAPSPTGLLHIGNARTAILNHIVAKKNNAELIIRVEDTDRERSSIESENAILEDLKWLGIKWTEGPDCVGNYGPYRQTERYSIYKEYTEKLLKEKKAYHCYCSKEELDEMRAIADKEKRPFSYPGKCRNLSDEQKKELEAKGIKPTIRFRVPENEIVTINDKIRGKISFNSDHIGGDFIIVRSDGHPIYNYIVTIDDTLMKVTDVIRGEDHLPNTPKQILVAKALGLPEPSYAHMPLIVGADRAKLSKRHGITSVRLYKEEGYLPEAIVNYISLLGWSPEDGEEIMSEEKLIETFELSKIAKSAAVFDFQKLKWMNAIYIRNYDLEKITDLFIPYIQEAGYNTETINKEELNKIIEIIRGNCEILSDIKHWIPMFLDDICKPDEKTDKFLQNEESKIVIKAAYESIKSSVNSENYVSELIPAIKTASSQKGKKLFWPIRGIITGRLSGPEMDLALPVIGFEKCVKRITYYFEKYCN